MEIKTIEDTDKAIGILVNWVINNKQLMDTLRSSRDSAIRWLTLETAIFDNMPIDNITFWNWETGEIIKDRIRDRFFYEMQKRTEIDFGFCKYFNPHWRNVTEYFLSGCKTNPEYNWNLCKYSGPILTTCEGTNNDRCVILPREERKKIIFDEAYYSALRQANISLKKAEERAIREN